MGKGRSENLWVFGAYAFGNVRAQVCTQNFLPQTPSTPSFSALPIHSNQPQKFGNNDDCFPAPHPQDPDSVGLEGEVDLEAFAFSKSTASTLPTRFLSCVRVEDYCALH